MRALGVNFAGLARKGESRSTSYATHDPRKMLLIRYDTDGRIEIADTLPPDKRPRWMATIQLTPYLKLNVVDFAAYAPLFDATVDRPYSVHILKSNLQKCMRRRDKCRGLVTGWALLCQDPIETLRRLPVIIAEDSLVQPRLYIELIWLMAATSKGYRLTWTDAATIMAALATALENTERVAIYVEPVDMYVDKTKVLLSFALMIRAEFGGMDHDRDFLRLLAARAASLDLPTDTAEPSWVEHDIDPIHPSEHILLEAIDQHCCPHVLRELPALHLQAIWWCRSSLSVRPFIGRGAADATATGEAKHAEHSANLEASRTALDAFSRRQIARGWITPTVSVSRKTNTGRVGPLDAWLASVSKR